jgi:hypothetical protein
MHYSCSWSKWILVGGGGGGGGGGGVRKLVVLWREVEMRNRKQQGKHKKKRRHQRKDKTQETKINKHAVSNVTAVRWLIKIRKKPKLNSEKILKMRKKIVKWYGKYGRKLSWNMKWFRKYRRK